MRASLVMIDVILFTAQSFPLVEGWPDLVGPGCVDVMFDTPYLRTLA